VNTVIFACVHNAGRSQMAAAFFNSMTDRTKARAVSAGTEPGERVHPEVVAAMAELGIDLSGAKPQRLTMELATRGSLLVTMGCGDACPAVPGLRRDDWPLSDPKGKPLEEVRRIRDEIRVRVTALLTAERWQRTGFAANRRDHMKVILFGATGMVGQGVLRECLLDDGVEAVLAVGRSSTGRTDPKLRELVRGDLFDFGVAGADLQGYDACFFCLGVSSAGMSEADYTRLTYDLTLGWARTLAAINPAMTFVYVSGAGTGGRAMWAQVKKHTEDALLELFPSAYMVRLGALRAMNGEISKTRWTRVAYAFFRPLFSLMRAIAPGTVISTEELGRAMIRAARKGAPARVLESRDLRALGA